MIKDPKDCRALDAFAFTDKDMNLLLGGDNKSIRKLDLTEPRQGCQILDNKLLSSENPLSGTGTNTPRYMDFNHEASLVAVAYRGYSLSVWSFLE